MSDVPDYDSIIQSIKAAPALPAPTGKVVRVDSAIAIVRAIEDADEGSTILIAKGRYVMPRDVRLCTHRLTVRGETGNRDDVILDLAQEFNDGNPQFKTRLQDPAIIKIMQARDVTIADLTLANSPKYGLLFFGSGRVHGLKVYNVKFHNIWARGIKGTGSYRIDAQEVKHMDVNTAEFREWVRARNGEIRHCLFIADTVKQNVEDGFNGDYIAGMDLMNVDHFTIADCHFVGIRGKNGGARGGVFIWQHADHVLVENNHFYHCDKGVSLGNPSAQDKRDYHIRDSIIRNNTFIGGSNKAIEVDYGNNVQILQNHIESDVRKDFAAIQVLHISDNAMVAGNRIRLHGEEPFNCDAQVTIGDNHIESTVSQ